MHRFRSLLPACALAAVLGAVYVATPATAGSKLAKQLRSLSQRVAALEGKSGTPGPQGAPGAPGQPGTQGIKGPSDGLVFMGMAQGTAGCNPGPCFGPVDGFAGITGTEAAVTHTSPNVQLTARDLAVTMPGQMASAQGLTVTLRDGQDTALTCSFTTMVQTSCNSGAATEVIAPGSPLSIKITGASVTGSGLSVGWRAAP